MVFAKKWEEIKPEENLEQRLVHIEQLKNKIEKDYNSLSSFFLKMVEDGQKQYDKGKDISIIQTEWQAGYKKFGHAFLNNDVPGMISSIITVQINIGADTIPKRFYGENEAAVKKYNDKATGILDKLLANVKLLEKYEKEEFEQKPKMLEIKDFKPEFPWMISESEQVQKIEEMKDKNEQLAEQLATEWHNQKLIEQAEKIEEREMRKRGEKVVRSDLEKEIHKALVELKLKIVHKMEKLLENVEQGGEINVSEEETIPAGVIREIESIVQQGELPPNVPQQTGKLIDIKKISEEPTIDYSKYEDKK